MSDTVATQLYLISPQEFELDSFSSQLKEAVASDIVTCFQLRMPDADDAMLTRAIEKLAPICWDEDVAFLLCDQAELVKSMKLDGVHLEGNVTEQAVKAARKTLGEDSSIGVSCFSSRHIAMLAGEAGADYVSFGPVFDSATKDMEADDQSLEALHWWAVMMELPCVAVGGLTPQNCGEAVTNGADFVAAVSAIWQDSKGPAHAVAEFEKAMAAATS